MTTEAARAKLYDRDYYAENTAGSASSAAVVVPILAELIQPTSVLDVGCGIGEWLWEWIDYEVFDVTGVDGEYTRELQRLLAPGQRFIAHGLTKPLHLERRFGLVTCLEVAEHLPPRTARTLVDTLCRHGDVVAFSAAPPGQGGTDHINLHWPSYWAKLFAQNGFEPYDLIRDRIWWDQRVAWWYRQNIVLFANKRGGGRLRMRVKKAAAPPSVNRSLDLAQPALLMPELQPPLEATVCIPWRPTPSRLKAFARVKAFWEMFGWPVITADSDTKIFSLAQARNNAVRQASTDVVVIADADTLVDPLNILRAVAEPDGICWPFTKYRILTNDYLDTPLTELAGAPFVNTWDGDGVAGVGGCMVCTRREFFRLGGQPPEFVGWGWEDVAFTLIVRTLSQAKRLRGHVYAFEHNQQAEKYMGAKADSPGWNREWSPNEDQFKYYRVADNRAWLMRELLKQRAADNPDDPLNWTA